MAKAKRVTVRLDDELDAIINQACVDDNCDKTTVILSALRKGLATNDDQNGVANRPSMTPRKEAYDVLNASTGGIYRYNASGKLMFYFKPIEVINGVQYYRDNLSDNPDNRWHRGPRGNWIPTATIVRLH